MTETTTTVKNVYHCWISLFLKLRK